MTLIVLGFLIEALGLGLTGTGLWQTWRANAAGRDFLPARVRRWVDWVKHSVLRRPRPSISVSANAVLPPLEMVGHITAKQTFTEYMTIDEKVNVVQANALAALQSAGNLASELRAERRQRSESDDRLSARIQGTEHQVREFARSMVVDGIPLAVLGVVLTTIGLLLQTIASAMGVPSN